MKKIVRIVIVFVTMLTTLAILVLFVLDKKNPAEKLGSNTESISQEVPMMEKVPLNSNDNGIFVPIDDSSKNILLPGKQTDNPVILAKYGKFAFETFQKIPNLVEKIRLVDKDFDPVQMDTSFPSHVYLLENGKEFLAIGGCVSHDCSGTEKVILYSEKDNLVFEAAENSSQTQLSILGEPSAEEQDLLVYYYFHN